MRGEGEEVVEGGTTALVEMHAVLCQNDVWFR